MKIATSLIPLLLMNTAAQTSAGGLIRGMMNIEDSEERKLGYDWSSKSWSMDSSRSSKHSHSSSSSDDSSSDDSSSDDHHKVDHGAPTKIEFWKDRKSKDFCFAFDKEKKYEILEADDCDHAPKFTYREDYLLELYDDGSKDLCLKEYDHAKLVKLVKCDCDDETQKFYFSRVATDKGHRVYRIMNAKTGNWIEREGGKIITKNDDPDEKDQWVKGLGADFFKIGW